MMQRWQVKLLAILLTLALMLVVVFIPFKIMACFKKLGSRGTRLLVTLSCFTGGVFLGTCLLFLIPEVFHLMTEPYYGFEHFPMAETTIGVGFMFIMFLERFVHSCKRKKTKKINREVQTNGCNGSTATPSPAIHEINNNEKDVQTLVQSNGETKYFQVELDNRLDEEETASVDSLTDESATKVIILFLALALDEFLGGISLGLQRTSGAVWGVLVGLLAHECVVGFSYGLQLAGLVSKKPCLSYTLGAMYALMSPVGSVVGMMIGEFVFSESINFVNGVLQGIATGVFLYVTFFEILEGKVNSKSTYKDLLAVSAGFFIMVFIALIPREGSMKQTDADYLLEHMNNKTTVQQTTYA
ncbi:hypothetical protein HELRODRAFT_185417 [Helobdella robusta]|uniref:Zinc/iron permease n=1 Tax=Helobdella robusta TaxID=6412 RepID=T1FMS7_HELRO|nr:hypothetical protein HELRODRAFT_185417 [Helobdella robusta]ESO08050.1 hypothetical protein HELRODRAFT_185417 [Helobdella robusta]